MNAPAALIRANFCIKFGYGKELDLTVAKEDRRPCHPAEVTHRMTNEMANETETSELDNQGAIVMPWLPQGWQNAAGTDGAITR
jgi:hypothetical protein